METVLLAIGILGIGILGMSVRLLFIKNAEVRGGCASKNPLLAEQGVICGVCGVKVGEPCGDDSKAK